MKKEEKTTTRIPHAPNAFLNKLKDYLWFAGKHAFLCMVAFIIIDVIIGEFLWYRYAILANTQEPDNIVVATKFKEQAYNNVMSEWQKREKMFDAPLPQYYADPFR